jgi:hypothetical protein
LWAALKTVLSAKKDGKHLITDTLRTATFSISRAIADKVHVSYIIRVMATVGEAVQEAVDLMNSGAYERAVPPTAAAIDLTVRKINGKDAFSELDCGRFLKDNWDLITFMGMPRALPLPMNIPFALKQIIPTFNSLHGALEIITMVITETLKQRQMPAEFSFNWTGKFEVKNDKLLLPSGLVCGLLGSVIFHPLNKDETIGEMYWISISDFKMFVSELFGKQELADRIMRFYSE